ncbi:RNAse G [Halobacillus karajensis]|uniref:Ribonuclease G n=1 Tax=Halobacillus karajensis TaxID=195088 RepID=A0A024P6H6_9BACI|nr:ribonuclease E/G [Halobacillus karajensis]CDQ18134.1 Ribonuclease G [Halobacillus karajensis]CDQ24485.1 Ribonuclease G [Halobacillus karajensis]CDQ29267.1 Ribonuclease G [Halobacillus karajensis]SEH58605.1 RNAse G [Halobacillus karajensis]
MRKIHIHTKTTEKTGLVIENGEVHEYVFDRPGAKKLAGSIFLGRVEQLDHGLGAAFIDIGEKRNAFLRKESIPWCEGKINSAIKVGEKIVVQVTKEPLGDKGAQVTADITFPGLYTVFQPFGFGKLSISRKLNVEKGAELEILLQKELLEPEGGIVRTAAGYVDDDIIMEEFRLLRREWQQLEKKRNDKPSLLWKDRLLPDQLIRKFPVPSIQEIVMGDVMESNNLKEKFPSLASRIDWKKDIEQDFPVSVSHLQMQLADPVVHMENGVNLVIEETEAMTVIDVNSHKVKGKSFINSQALEVNLLAANEIQRQIRLRKLSGMILIDFISMKDERKEKKLLSEMRKLVKKDPVKTTVLGMTRLGLIEMTRRREGKSLPSLLTHSSVSFTLETMVYRLERELLTRRDAEAILIGVHPDLFNRKKQLLSVPISSKIPQELFVRQDVDISDYQIELEGSLDMIREAIQHRGYYVDNLF